MPKDMTIADMRQVRHTAERGDILRTLKEDYQAEMTTLRTLLSALDLQGTPLSQEDLEFHLTYLAAQGYVQVWRARDMPNHRADRRGRGWEKPSTMLFAKLLPRGLQLLDGAIPEDPQIRF